MFCKNCGAAMPDEASFCPVCGQNSRLPVDQSQAGNQNPQQGFDQPPFVAPSYQQQELPHVPQHMPPQMPIDRRGKNTKLIIILAAAIVLIAAAIVVLALLVFRKSPDIEGTWTGRISLEMSKDDSDLEEDFADLLDRASDAILIFDMDDDGTGTAEIYFEDYPTDEIELDVKLNGKKFSMTGDMLGYDTKITGKIDQKNDNLSLAGDGTTEGRKGNMSAELAFDKESDKKIRPTTEETTYENGGDTADTTPPVTETVPPTETTQAETTQTETTQVETTQEVTVTVPTDSMVDNPGLVDGYLLGDWISGPYPDGTASIMVFYDEENVTWFIAYPGESTDDPMEGYKNNTWDIEYISDGTYYTEGNQMFMSWIDMDGFGDEYDVAIVGENDMDLTLYFEGEPYTDRYQRVIWE